MGGSRCCRHGCGIWRSRRSTWRRSTGSPRRGRCELKGRWPVATLSDLLALLPDNTSGQITPAAMRTIVTDLYSAAHPAYLNVVNQGPAALAANAAWTAVPGTGPFNFTLADPAEVQFILSLNADTQTTGNQV